MNIYDGFGYTGGQFTLIYQDIIGYLQGNALCLWNLETNKKEYIQSSKNGFQCFCANHKKRMIAVAEYGLKPQVFLYSYPSREQIMTLDGVSELEIVMMDFSFDGKFLLVVTGVPKYEINIWDLELGRKIQGENSTLPQKFNFNTASFSSTQNNKFALMYKKSLLMYEMVPSYERDEENVQKKLKLEQQGVFALNANKQFMVWDYLSELDTGDGKDQTNVIYNNIFGIRYIWCKIKPLFTYLELVQMKQLDMYNIQIKHIKKECQKTVEHLIVTQKHIIIVYESGLMEWIFKYININLNDQLLLPFKLDKQYTQISGSHSEKRSSQVIYNHSYTKLFVGLVDASLMVINVPAESSIEDEEDGDQGKDRSEEEVQEGQVKQVDAESTKLGPYQTGSVSFLKEFKSVHVLVSGSSSGKIVFWDLLRRDALGSVTVKGSITSGEIGLNDQYLIVGSSLGVIRMLNIANIRKPILVKSLKIFKGKAVSCVAINPTYDILAVVSKNSKKVYFLNLKYNMALIGYITLPVRCNNIVWNNQPKQVVGQGGAAQLFIVTSFLLISVTPPDPNQQYETLKLTKENCPMYARKIDPDQILLTVHPKTGDIITAGKDKVFKKYKQPEESIIRMDLKVKLANQGPLEEQDGHALPATCMIASPKLGCLCSGAEDGSLILRSYDKLSTEIQQFRGHSLRQGGVSALEVSNKYKMIFTGGFDGGIFWWSQEKPLKTESDAEKVMRNQFDIALSVDDYVDQDVKHYQLVLEEEYMESQAPIREQQKKDKKDLLQAIKNKLDNLIENNRVADPMEQLSRDDFVIDMMSRNEIIEWGQKQCQQLRESVKRDNYKQEILYKLIKEKTWDQMECQLKGINGLNSNILVTNFHIRVRGTDEIRKLQLVKELRAQELKEKIKRKELKQPEIWHIEDLLQDPRAYIVNAISGQPQLVITDYEKKEEPLQTAKGVAKAVPGQKTATRVTAGKTAAKPTDEEKEKEEKEKEEKEKEKAAAKVDEKKEGEQFGEWDYIYGSFELFTNNRKRNQIILLNNIIFSIKRAFNVEFEKMMQSRQTEVENINERNKRITEILQELKKGVDLFGCKKNILDNPESILLVGNDEIPFQKYLSKEERERREIERKKEEERLANLMKDDAGLRAIKDMMNGTLEEKKETPLDEKLEIEEWMTKPLDEMTEEERSRLKEFEVKRQRLEEEKEKIRKNLESDLKKLRQEIIEICFRFDDHVLTLFRRKLEYDYRIYEQELYMIRLSLSIIMQEQGNVKIKELKSMITQLEIKEKQSQMMYEDLEAVKKETELQRQRSLDQMTAAYNVKSSYGFDAGKIKNIWLYAFEEVKKDDKKQKELDNKLLADTANQGILILIDPMYEFHKKEMKKDRDTIFDNFLKDIQEKVQNLQLFDWNDPGAREFTISTLQNRFNVKKEFEKFDQELNHQKFFCTFYVNQQTQIQSGLQNSHNDHQDIITMMEKSKSNVEILVRFKQGLVEITQDKPVPNLTEAVLIPRKQIDEKNKEIQAQGDHKIKLMEDIKKIKFDVAQSEYQLKRRELIIKDLECKTREVQLLKVKKEMQVALTKKDTRLNDQELKNLQDQIDMLKGATEKRILIYQKKEDKIKKDIEFIQKENEQLLQQGANLNVSVKQLQEINDMTFKKNAKQNKEVDDITDNQAFDKFRQIASNRKYFDLAKKQTEEIELLREELNKLKARTFANFANVSR